MTGDARALDRWTVLLAHHDRFIASYVRQAMADAGATVLKAIDPECGRADWDQVDACVVSTRLGAMLRASMEMCGADGPRLLVLSDTVSSTSGADVAILSYPFASYQVVDALVHLGRLKDRRTEEGSLRLLAEEVPPLQHVALVEEQQPTVF
jgi:hypothetical protein